MAELRRVRTSREYLSIERNLAKCDHQVQLIIERAGQILSNLGVQIRCVQALFVNPSGAQLYACVGDLSRGALGLFPLDRTYMTLKLDMNLDI